MYVPVVLAWAFIIDQTSAHGQLLQAAHWILISVRSHFAGNLMLRCVVDGAVLPFTHDILAM